MSKKFTIFAIGAAVILAGIILIFPDNQNQQKADNTAVVDASSVSRRIDYFASHGWDVEEISGKDITIPAEFTEEYEQYAAIQDKQGLPLREYAGKPGKIYVYEVRNFDPSEQHMLAELLVCDDTAIASLVYSDNGGELRFAVN